MDQDRYRRELAQVGLEEATLKVDGGGTMVGPWSPAGESTERGADELPLLVGEGGELVLGETLGRGGMGFVRLARQRSLGREVAVKSAVAGSHERHEVGSQLIREARVTGALEHPNIVPVHALGRDERGEALLVMKRIEGTSWAERLRARASTLEDLDHHLEVFMEVCQTVRFAHSRGVVHRDLKPDNVMLGAFGEVYVLDWGLAVAISERSIPGLPRAETVSSIAGTPHFMAPEMTLPGGLIDERTDTFLLGATLHVVLTGRPPYAGLTIMEVLFHAHSCPAIELPAEVPAELAAICTRALAREPAERFATAEQLRLAISEFREHASARALVAQAREPLREWWPSAAMTSPSTARSPLRGSASWRRGGCGPSPPMRAPESSRRSS